MVKEIDITSATRHLLRDGLELNLENPNLVETPSRVAKYWKALFKTPYPKLTTFPLEGKGGMIFIKDHTAFSFCPHHLLPVEYNFKIGYVPEKDVLGLSKLARIADYCVRDMPLQEDIPYRIGKHILASIHPKGVGVIVEGKHMCMRMRGVESPCATAVSTFMWGVFLELGPTREEFITL